MTDKLGQPPLIDTDSNVPGIIKFLGRMVKAVVAFAALVGTTVGAVTHFAGASVAAGPQPSLPGLTDGSAASGLAQSQTPIPERPVDFVPMAGPGQGLSL